MKKSYSIRALGSLLLLAISFAILPLTALTFAQNNSSTSTSTQTSAPAQSTGSSSQSTTTRTTQTETSPAQVTRTVEKKTGVDPLWIGLGAVALIAILAIVILSARGRSTDRVATVHEHTTVVKKE